MGQTFEVITGTGAFLLFPGMPLFYVSVLPPETRDWMKYFLAPCEPLLKAIAWGNIIFYTTVGLMFLNSALFWMKQIW